MREIKSKLALIPIAFAIVGIGFVFWRLVSADHIERRPKAADYSDFIAIIKHNLEKLPDSNPNKMISAFEDVRSCDLTGFDLTHMNNWLDFISFDSKTKWPEKMPAGFFPEEVMEIGKDPGLGIRSLHRQGIDGRGVSIGMIDYPLLTEHVEYRKNLRWYQEMNWPDKENTASMHGPAMASIAVGKNVGIAPGANIYYIACGNIKPHPSLRGVSLIDFANEAKAIDRILEINQKLPQKKKIRAISISAAWSPDMSGYLEINQAVKRAVDQGIFVISCNIFETYYDKFYYQVLERDPLADPDDFSSYSVIPWDKSIRLVKKPRSLFDKYYEEQFDRLAKVEILLVPINSRTNASPTGKKDYAYFRGGWSEVEPFLAGLYALACQIKPDLTPVLFWQRSLETGIDREVVKGDKKYPGKIINPVKLIRSLR
jgi:hypothetical protein